MSEDSTRRSFLRKAGVGAAAAGVAVVGLPSVATAGAAAATGPSTLREPLLAYVSDPSKGEITVMVGERETVVTDHELVARLSRVAG